MHKSIEGELQDLKKRLGPSPITPVFEGLAFIRYHVTAGTGIELIREVGRKTGYRLARAWRQVKAGEVYYELLLDPSLPAMIVYENGRSLEGYPRLDGLAFRVRDLQPVRDSLRNACIPSREEPWGIATDPIPGPGDRFLYLPEGTPAWHEAPGMEPQQIAPESAGTAPFTDVRANIGHLDHIAYRVPLSHVHRTAEMIMKLSGYSFDSCYTVGDQNAETMVFRWGSRKPAIVVSYGWDEQSVVHAYTAKYGPRVHHTAYYTDDLRTVLQRQQELGLTFTTEELIGDETRGILQIFGTPSPISHEITEYVQRFGSFTGFFDKGNVGELMGSTKGLS